MSICLIIGIGLCENKRAERFFKWFDSLTKLLARFLTAIKLFTFEYSVVVDDDSVSSVVELTEQLTIMADKMQLVVLNVLPTYNIFYSLLILVPSFYSDAID